jgi:hypothetical protein
MTSLDTVGNETLKWSFWIAFFASLFISLKIAVFLLFLCFFIYCFLAFLIFYNWAKEPHPEKSREIAFFITLFHSFLFLLGGALGILIAKGLAIDLFKISIAQISNIFSNVWKF